MIWMRTDSREWPGRARRFLTLREALLKVHQPRPNNDDGIEMPGAGGFSHCGSPSAWYESLAHVQATGKGGGTWHFQ